MEDQLGSPYLPRCLESLILLSVSIASRILHLQALHGGMPWMQWNSCLSDMQILDLFRQAALLIFLPNSLFIFSTFFQHHHGSPFETSPKATDYKLFDIKQSNYEEIKVKNLEFTCCWDDRTPDLNRSGHTGNRNPTCQNDFLFFKISKVCF